MNTTRSTITRNKTLIAWLLLCVLATMWGSSFLIIKKALHSFSPVQIGALRIMSAGLVFLPWVISKRKDFPKEKTRYFIACGFLGYLFPAFLFAFAGTRVNSSLIGTLNSTTPLFVLVVGSLFFQQIIRRWQSVGLILGFTGSIVLILSGSKDGLSFNNPYALLVILSTLIYGFNVNITGKHLSTINPVLLTGWTLFGVAIVAGVVLFSTDFVARINETNREALLLVIFLGVVNSGIATIIFNYILQIASPVFAASVAYLMPIVATIMGFLDGEPISILHFSGMSIILVGVYLINKK